MDLNGSHIVITGASKGLGAGLARELSSRGARLTLIARPSEELTAVATETAGFPLPLDLSRPENFPDAISRAEKAAGPVEVLINNAGVLCPGSFPTRTGEELQGQLTANLLAPMELSRQALPGMLSRGRGTIVTVSSLAGEIAVPHYTGYATTKAGLTTFMLHLQRELRNTPLVARLVILGLVSGTNLVADGVQDPVIAKLECKVARLPQLTPATVARSVADSLATSRRQVLVLPTMLAPLIRLRMLSHRLADLALRDVAADHSALASAQGGTR